LEDAFERGVEHIFVFGHEPAFPIGGHLDDCLPDVGWFLKDTSDSSRLIHIEERDRFWGMLETYDVDAYICGHEHNYGRQSVDGVYQIVSGGAGAPLYELNPLFGDNPPVRRPGQSLTYNEAVPFYEMLGYPHGPGDNCQASEDFVGGKYFQYTVFRLSGPKVFVETWGIDPATGQRDVMEVDATIELKDEFVIEKRD
jgi:hypothetical protein